MKPEQRLFLDTSALFAGIWSAGGGGRMLLKLGEAGVVQLLVSPQVLEELEGVMRRKAAQQLATLAALLDRCQVRVMPTATGAFLERCRGMVSHPGDARILADAWHNQSDYTVTLDKAHFLVKPGLSEPFLPEQAPFPIGTPGDCLAWLRGTFKDAVEF